MNRKVLKASAGTGKTYRLSLEYIASILNGENFEEILVMTFTKKATAEIRSRIFQHLDSLLGSSEPEKEELSGNLKKLYPGIVLDEKLLRSAYERMLANKDKVKIYTLDSFTNMLFKKAISPHLNVYSYEIIDDDKNEFYLESVLKKLISEKRYFDKLKIFFQNRAFKNIDDYLHLISELLNNRWKFLVIDGSSNLKPKQKKGLSDFFIIFEEMLLLIEEGRKIKNPEKPFEEAIKTKFRGYLSLNGAEGKKEFLTLNFKALLAEKNFWVDSFIKPTKKVPETSGIYERVVSFYDDFKESLAGYIYDEVMLPTEDEILEFSNHVFDIYDSFKFSDKKFTHNDISTYTYKFFSSRNLGILSDGRATEYLYQLIGSKIKTMFIDEFQDTSILQWKILLPLIENAENLIAVGDEKQSIYGWRGGEKKLFEKLEKIIGADEERMDTSFRSEKNIMGFVNGFFNKSDERWQYEDVKHLDSKNGGYVELHIDGKNSESSPIEKLVNAIKCKIKNYGSVSVVARRKKDLNEISARLDEEKIPYITNDGQCIVEHRAIKGIYYLIKYLVYRDYFSLACFLRDEIIDIDGNSLKFLLQNRSAIEVYLNGGESLELPSELGQVLSYVRGYNNKKFSQFQTEGDSIKDVVRSFFEEFGVAAKFSSNSDLKNIYYFYQLLREHSSLNDLISYVEENRNSQALKQLAVEDLNAVKLMTIHKSKGLEFDTELFYFKQSKTPPSNNFKFYIKFSDDYTYVEDYFLCFPKYKDVLGVLGLDFESQESEKEEMEEINNFYVALTRPKKNLFVFMDMNRDLEKCSDEFYIRGIKNASEMEFSEEVEEYSDSAGIFSCASVPEKVALKIPTGVKKYFSTTKLCDISVEKKHEAFKISIEKENKRKIGLAMHYYMEFLKHNSDKERELATKMVLSKYGNMFGRDKIASILDRITHFIFNNEDILEYDIFNKKYDVLNEYEIVEVSEGILRKYRIDRLNIDHKNKYALIVDYKTGESKDPAQIEMYKTLVANRLGTDYCVDAIFLEIE